MWIYEYILYVISPCHIGNIGVNMSKSLYAVNFNEINEWIDVAFNLF